jgi:hypothetical protein
MDMNFMYPINYWAVLLSSVVYFVIGMLWFAPSFFGSIWRKELEQHRVTFLGVTAEKMLLNMGVTFASCILAALGLAWFIQVTGCVSAFSGFMLGSIISACFVIPSVATIFVWESRSMMLFLIDVGYPVVGIIVSAIILTLWQ